MPDAHEKRLEWYQTSDTLSDSSASPFNLDCSHLHQQSSTLNKVSSKILQNTFKTTCKINDMCSNLHTGFM